MIDLRGTNPTKQTRTNQNDDDDDDGGGKKDAHEDGNIVCRRENCCYLFGLDRLGRLLCVCYFVAVGFFFTSLFFQLVKLLTSNDSDGNMLFLYEETNNKAKIQQLSTGGFMDSK